MGGRFVSRFEIPKRESVVFCHDAAASSATVAMGGVAGSEAGQVIEADNQIRPTPEVEACMRVIVRRFIDRITVWAVRKGWATSNVIPDPPPGPNMVMAPWSSDKGHRVAMYPRNMLELHDLILTELAEYERARTTENQMEELADAAIRIIQLYGEYGLQVPPKLPSRHEDWRDLSVSFVLAQASEEWRKKGPIETRWEGVAVDLFYVLCRLFEMSFRYRINRPLPDQIFGMANVFSDAIETKMNVNDTRPYMHGKEA